MPTSSRERPNGAADEPRRAGKPQAFPSEIGLIRRLDTAARPPGHLQPRHHLLHPFLADVGVNLGGGDALVAEQGLDVHQLRPGVEQVGRVSMAQLVRADFLLDPGFLHHPPQVSAGRLRGDRLAVRLGKDRLAPGSILEPEPEHLGERGG